MLLSTALTSSTNFLHLWGVDSNNKSCEKSKLEKYYIQNTKEQVWDFGALYFNKVRC